MTLADTLSRLPSCEDNEDIDLDLRVDVIEFTAGEIHQSEFDLVNFSINKCYQLWTEKTKLHTCEDVYWSYISKDIKEMCRSCQICQEFATSNNRELLIPHDISSTLWKKLGTDLFEINGKTYLLICDYFSKFPIVTYLSQTASKAVTEEFKKIVSLFGKPDEIFSDNGPQYTSKPFQQFAQEWGIQHTTSSPRYPQSNRFIERQVQTIKKTIQKCEQSKEDINSALMNLRATPLKMPSPAEILLSRPITTLVPLRWSYSYKTQRLRKLLKKKRKYK
ncbi:uncharacterized protein K02A2.6-like [Octopus bimaculoides]|uniref:uncharacterized protein K02A2.6-like n=1 Tax=Octopus bimaculoides TaxID=37653 RepID=UPI00071E3142|nr:uncharacterized protein K02A2.6-like [Octopus bimaculoides]|eukprot:XP_014781662.1 PREDICTED: uncharacterized protein K02A2.6-like [Octopus bimaculoides]